MPELWYWRRIHLYLDTLDRPPSHGRVKFSLGVKAYTRISRDVGHMDSLYFLILARFNTPHESISQLSR